MEVDFSVGCNQSNVLHTAVPHVHEDIPTYTPDGKLTNTRCFFLQIVCINGTNTNLHIYFKFNSSNFFRVFSKHNINYIYWHKNMQFKFFLC